MRSKQNLIFLFIIYEVMGPDPVYLQYLSNAHVPPVQILAHKNKNIVFFAVTTCE